MSPTTIRRHSVTLQGHRTSISLENAFWDSLRSIALRRGISINLLITEIDKTRDGNLSSALRVLALEDAIQESGKSMGLI
ncbi:MAG: ribbon-helix-helix domain-containing protein [Rhodospirillales bacterium]